jgi:DNA-binding GntR family transcriptional regulator
VADSQPDDARAPYLQVVDDLRRAILTRRIEPGGKLPSNAELKRKYEVAGQTAQNAINALKSEGLVYGVAGRGVFVRSDIDYSSLERDDDPDDQSTVAKLVSKVEQLTEKFEALEARVKDLEGS